MRTHRWRVGLVLLMAVAGAGSAGSAAEAASGKVSVVAAEDFWGSIARQLGGEHADVTSIIADPDTDPHDYEPKPSDGAALATAQVAIVNGIGYDGWTTKLLAANPSSGRKAVTVGDVIGVNDGGNPHQWYSPRSVNAVIDAITDALKQADPADAAYFDRQRQVYRAEGLKRYNDLRARLKEQYQGTPVGASESIFAPLAEDLGLKLLTPESFLDAISEGNEPTAKDKSTVDQQVTGKHIKVFVYNSQNSTPDVAALVEKSKQAGIPVATVTETLTPKGASFQDWQANQLQSLADALAQATGKPASSVSAAPVPAAATTTPSPDTGPSPAGDVAAAAPTGPLARTGTFAGWLVPLAGFAFVLGGFGVVCGATPRRNRSQMAGTAAGG
ncbi:MAG: zinc/manganese transport system substrate-binding protein [Actinomycetota bacterium]|jgi:zinc/manganese transport system substrate-binding protein|nr:zinc/manganese transport system substrate-binding protein [Actinomycetota bacterium]